MTFDVSSDKLEDDDFQIVTHEQTKGYLEEEFELFEPASEEEIKQFEETRDNNPSSRPFDHEKLGRLFLKKIKEEKFTQQESFVHPTWSMLYYHVLTNDENGQKIILCCPTAEFKTEKDFELPDLNQLLLFLKERQIYSPDNILLIPITEPYRGFGQGHFRLLAFMNHTISYFDSKNIYCQQLNRYFTPAKSAVYVSLEEISKRMTEAVGFIQQLSVVAQSTIEIPFRYLYYLDLVRKICTDHFPDMSFSPQALATQPWYNETQCGEKTIEAGMAIARSGLRLGMVKS